MSEGFTGVHSDQVSLQPYQEIVGRLNALREADGVRVVELSSGVLTYPTSSTEAAICERYLCDREGATVSIIRTTSPDNPLLVSIADSEEPV